MNHTQRRRQPAQNVPSNLLTDGENDDLYSLLGRKCVTLATAVVQVYLARPDVTKWAKRCTGVCCFVKDNPKRSYFIRVYNIKSRELLWEQELYNQFKYSNPRPYFHTFDTDNCRAALNFASPEEADNFRRIVNDKIQQKHERRVAPVPQQQPTLHIATTDIRTNHVQEDATISYSKKDKKKKKNKKGKLTKADIGGPSDFKHVGHVGWDPNKGFDMNEVDPAVKELFSSAGITENQLKDKETAKFIYDFIEKRGGVDAVKRERTKPPLPPSRGVHAPPPPPRVQAFSHHEPLPSRREPPPPPVRLHIAQNLPPPPPSRPTTRQPPSASVPPPPPSSTNAAGNIPPPPPMPSTGSNSAPPPPPAMPMSNGGGRGALLEQIRGGMDLKDAGERAERPAPTSSGGGRGALLDQIRKGKALNKVTDIPAEKPEQEEDSGLAGALARALQQREKAIHTDSESDSENGFDDDEDWDD